MGVGGVGRRRRERPEAPHGVVDADVQGDHDAHRDEQVEQDVHPVQVDLKKEEMKGSVGSRLPIYLEERNSNFLWKH